MAKKTAARRTSSRKTTAAKSRTSSNGTVGVTDALVKKVLKARKAGKTWDEIMDELNVKVGQITPIRAAMRALDPESVSNSGPRKSSGKSSSAKKASAKGSSKKASSKKGARRKSRRTAGSPRTEEA